MSAPATLPQSDGAAAPSIAAPELSTAASLWSRAWRQWGAPTSLARRFLYGAAWTALAIAASRAFLLVGMVCTARMLGRELNGRLGVVQNTLGMFGVIAGCGLGVAATKFVAEMRRVDPERAGRVLAFTQLFSLALGGLAAIGCGCVAPWLAGQVLAEPALTPALRIGTLLVLFGALNGVQTGALTGFEAFRAVAVVNFIGGLLSIVLLIGCTWWYGLHGALWALATTAGVQAAAGQIALRTVAREWRIRIDFRRAWREARPVLRFCVPVGISASAVVPIEWAATALLVNTPGGYAEMGLYSAATQWFNAVSLIPAIVGQAVLPMLAERGGAGDRGGYVRLLLLAMVCNVAAVFPLVGLGWWQSRMLMSWNGPEFIEGASALCLLLTAALVIAVQTPVGNALQASGHSWIGLGMNAAWAATYLTAATYATQSGAEGLAGARLLAYVAHTAWMAVYVMYAARERQTSARSAAAAPVS